VIIFSLPRVVYHSEKIGEIKNVDTRPSTLSPMLTVISLDVIIYKLTAHFAQKLHLSILKRLYFSFIKKLFTQIQPFLPLIWHFFYEEWMTQYNKF